MHYCNVMSGNLLFLTLASSFLLYFLALFVAKNKMRTEDIQQYNQLYGVNRSNKNRVELSLNLIMLLFRFKPTVNHTMLLKSSQIITKISLVFALATLFFMAWIEASC